MSASILNLRDAGKATAGLVGGKGANLGELYRISGIHVPEGFCVTTEAYRAVTEKDTTLMRLLDELSGIKAHEREKISAASAGIRSIIENTSIPGSLAKAVVRQLAISGENKAFAVRSSATAEDLADASFAGQQDTFLNIRGKDAILGHIRKCWASLFTERAVLYRMQKGIDHRGVYLAVIVQEMVFPQASGILFTADPVTSNRKICSIDAGFGLGEALVAGLVNADGYKVRNNSISDKKIAVKKIAIQPLAAGGTAQQELAPEQQVKQVLRDEQILQLAQIGRTVEAHFGRPQDMEWCLADDVFYIVQSRPVTTLFPIPEAGDAENRVYVSVGHQQMMTDAIRPLGVSFRQLTAARPMFSAGGRLFVDITQQLSTPSGRNAMINVLGQSDPLIRDMLLNVTEREGFLELLPEEPQAGSKVAGLPGFQAQDVTDPAIVHTLIARNEASVAALREKIQTLSGPELIRFIEDDFAELKKQLFDPQSTGLIMAGFNTSAWLNEKMNAWLGEKNAADTLSQSVDNNITSEMGLALLDVADAIRPYPQVVAYLEEAKADNFPEALPALEGGTESRAAILGFLHKYGIRCTGEIDITRTRWAEKPLLLVPLILGNIRNFPAGESRRRFEQGRREALKKETELLERLRQLPGGEAKAAETKEKIDLLRSVIGYREYPKYGMMNRYFVYRQALLKEAERLVQAKAIAETEDIYFLTLDELHELTRSHKADQQLIRRRREEFRADEQLVPPRVMTSEGEIISGSYQHAHLPAGAIAGLAVSTGIVEGRARVILNMEDAVLEEGDILVTPFTDPGWTPLFLAIKGLVTEVGGLMTHGAVIAREYGLPAVVGVENATRLIRDGQRIRVNGTEGYVELL